MYKNIFLVSSHETKESCLEEIQKTIHPYLEEESYVICTRRIR